MPESTSNRSTSCSDPLELRGQSPKAQTADEPADLSDIVDQTVRLWRRHHLTYDQTKYVVERSRRRLDLSPPRERKRTVDRLDWSEVQRLIEAAYGLRSTYGLLVKTLLGWSKNSGKNRR